MDGVNTSVNTTGLAVFAPRLLPELELKATLE
jgi:hypothetical protein